MAVKAICINIGILFHIDDSSTFTYNIYGLDWEGTQGYGARYHCQSEIHNPQSDFSSFYKGRKKQGLNLSS